MTNENDPELDGKYLGTITQDFAKIADTLKEASQQLRFREISEYPIFPISKGEIPLGQLLLAKKESGLDWHFYFSFLEDFTARNIILPERVEKFQETFKDPDEFACLFVVDEAFTNFVFIPYPED